MKCTVCIDSETGECQVLSARVADFVRCVLFVPAEQHPGYRNNTRSISGIMPSKFVHSSAETLKKHKFLQLRVHELLLLHHRFL